MSHRRSGRRRRRSYWGCYGGRWGVGRSRRRCGCIVIIAVVIIVRGIVVIVVVFVIGFVVFGLVEQEVVAALDVAIVEVRRRRGIFNGDYLRRGRGIGNNIMIVRARGDCGELQGKEAEDEKDGGCECYPRA